MKMKCFMCFNFFAEIKYQFATSIRVLRSVMQKNFFYFIACGFYAKKIVLFTSCPYTPHNGIVDRSEQSSGKTEITDRYPKTVLDPN